MQGVLRLRVSPPIDGTARAVLFYLAWRHNAAKHYWPSLATMTDELGIKRSALIAAMARLEKRNLIHRRKGRGRGHGTTYILPWLQHHFLAPNSSEPIAWGEATYTDKRSNELHLSGVQKVQADAPFDSVKGPIQRAKRSNITCEKVQPVGPKRLKDLNTAPDQSPPVLQTPSSSIALSELATRLKPIRDSFPLRRNDLSFLRMKLNYPPEDHLEQALQLLIDTEATND